MARELQLSPRAKTILGPCAAKRDFQVLPARRAPRGCRSRGRRGGRKDGAEGQPLAGGRREEAAAGRGGGQSTATERAALLRDRRQTLRSGFGVGLAATLAAGWPRLNAESREVGRRVGGGRGKRVTLDPHGVFSEACCMR